MDKCRFPAAEAMYGVVVQRETKAVEKLRHEFGGGEA